MAGQCWLFPDVSGIMCGVDWERLSRYVIAQRVKAGFRTREQLATATGISARVLGDIEKARRGNYDPTTLAALEAALGWETGSIDSTLRGGEPTTARPATPEREHWEGKLERVRQIADNPDRSEALRTIARNQIAQIEIILDAARAEEEAQRRQAS